MASASDEGDGLGVVRVKPLGVGGGGVERSAAKGGGGGGAGREQVVQQNLSCACSHGVLTGFSPKMQEAIVYK